jgi:lipoprotein-anchoring transpeptidase ErfK/SrfK
LLQALNPGVDFGVAGTTITVTAAGADTLDRKVDRIEIDKSLGQVRAFDKDGALLATYPATVGSTERPAPSGEWAVRTLAPKPTYTYDPSRLTFGKPKGKLTIKAGPNNPVGSTWIDLTKDTYGIHGTPDPKLVNKRASHGCVRLTNWDAAELGSAVNKGAKVIFMGAEARAS